MFGCPKGMREYAVYIAEDGEDIDFINITENTPEYAIIYARNLEEAKIKAYEEFGECVIQWRRKNEWKGGYDYPVTKAEYEILKKDK